MQAAPSETAEAKPTCRAEMKSQSTTVASPQSFPAALRAAS